jgi:hypothetical protein
LGLGLKNALNLSANVGIISLSPSPLNALLLFAFGGDVRRTEGVGYFNVS